MARRLWAIVAMAVVALGGGAARVEGAPAKVAPPTLGLLHENRTSRLVRIDAALRVVPGPSLDVGFNTFAWSFSPDGSTLALGGDREGRYVPDVLFVETPTLRALGRVQLAPMGWVVATAWLSGGRLRAVVTTEEVDIVTVDTDRRRVVARRHLAGQLLHVARARDSLVLLLGGTRTIGPARLAVVRPSGRVDVAVLREVRAGGRRTARESGAEFRQVVPALAVDPDGGRAFVLPASGKVADVDLARLRVTYHTLSKRMPAAQAKSVEGPVRHARWLGNGLVAVSGADYSVADKRLVFTPSGVRLVDTRRWTVLAFAPGADGFHVAGNVLFAHSATWSSELHMPTPIGVEAYGLDGQPRFKLYEGERAWVVYADEQRAYVDPSGPGAVDVVDVATGRIVERRPSVPRPLVGRAEAAID
jgi:hypothetical protein